MKTAVVLFNLGGPDSLAAIRPFLFNLFNDRAIIGLPQPARWLLAQFISRRRAPVAKEIYAHMGGRSPLLEMTRKQAAGLKKQLTDENDDNDYEIFVTMRYWHPLSDETAKKVKAYDPDRVVLLPLYPQFSTTTTGSSLSDWQRAAAAAGLTAPSQIICCYPEHNGFVDTIARLAAESIAKAGQTAIPRVLFSAHGLPKKIIDAGDPYADHVEKTVNGVVARLAMDDLDWVICYQSRVGRLEWIGPSTEDEIARAARDGRAVVMVPVAFVSEHSETLVELDIEYRQRADSLGVPAYHRTATVGADDGFISGLKELVMAALNGGDSGAVPAVTSGSGGKRACATDCTVCLLVDKV